MIHDLMPQGKGVVSLASAVLCQMQGGSYSEMLFTEIQACRGVGQCGTGIRGARFQIAWNVQDQISALEHSAP